MADPAITEKEIALRPGQPGNGYGGPRPGAGRPKGSLNKRTKVAARWLNELLEEEPSFNPLTELVACYREAIRQRESQVAAGILVQLLPYLVPKLKPVDADPESALFLEAAKAQIKAEIGPLYEQMKGSEAFGQASLWVEKERAYAAALKTAQEAEVASGKNFEKEHEKDFFYAWLGKVLGEEDAENERRAAKFKEEHPDAWAAVKADTDELFEGIGRGEADDGDEEGPTAQFLRQAQDTRASEPAPAPVSPEPRHEVEEPVQPDPAPKPKRCYQIAEPEARPRLKPSPIAVQSSTPDDDYNPFKGT